MGIRIRRPRFVVKRWSAVAVWSWRMSVDNCAICRNHIMDHCLDCQAKHNKESQDITEQPGCTISWGACGHAFHLHCISTWLKTRRVCPLDNTQWDYRPDGL
ncbi:RING-box protein 1B [Theileria parva strain Muguga]|uniref:RING-type domain-containing protein n=1 Tax=Theileria parva TaxID=5875 RepID=Q4N1R0_THEPA|nr:RING-box protein 1B [Theileria parva strain Muguga]EAN32022.1 RING-box protein 1B [Theileria parva strain Muguga]|eukprot:XP_764305.1 hypothetical protein [Theileria parva strain Muguga]